MAKKGTKAKRGSGKAKRPAAAKKTAKTKTKRKPSAKRVTAKRAPARRQSAAARQPSPKPDPVRELAKRIVEVTVSNDDNATWGLYADNVESIERGSPPMTGIDALKQKFEMWRGMTSYAAFRPRKICIDGNLIMIEWEGTVTLSPSGKTVQLEEVAIHEIENGKIARERFYYDPSVLQQ